MDYNEILERYPEISEAYTVVNTFKLYMGQQQIKIQIEKDLKNGKYSYSNSHHYHGSKQATPYMSSRCVMIDSEAEALDGAIQELISYYDKNDDKAKWVKSKSF